MTGQLLNELHFLRSFGCFFSIRDTECSKDCHRFVANRGNRKTKISGKFVVSLSFDHALQDLYLALRHSGRARAALIKVFVVKCKEFAVREIKMKALNKELPPPLLLLKFAYVSGHSTRKIH
jgi:hypothetical protein